MPRAPSLVHVESRCSLVWLAKVLTLQATPHELTSSQCLRCSSRLGRTTAAPHAWTATAVRSWLETRSKRVPSRSPSAVHAQSEALQPCAMLGCQLFADAPPRLGWAWRRAAAGDPDAPRCRASTIGWLAKVLTRQATPHELASSQCLRCSSRLGRTTAAPHAWTATAVRSWLETRSKRVPSRSPSAVHAQSEALQPFAMLGCQLFADAPPRLGWAWRLQYRLDVLAPES